jgi:hypothetical protein
MAGKSRRFRDRYAARSLRSADRDRIINIETTRDKGAPDDP